jgi:hypothetical protein
MNTTIKHHAWLTSNFRSSNDRKVYEINNMISQFLLITGCILILHAAYSLQHYRSLVQDIIESSTGISLDIIDDATAATTTTASSVPQSDTLINYRIPPLDIYIELAIAFVLLLISEFVRSGASFQRAIVIKGDKIIQEKSSMIGTPFITRDFDIYTTRKSKI